jgi:hypothetical protein
VLGIKAIGKAADDSLDPVDLFGDGISELTESKVKPFIEAMDELDLVTTRLDWGNAIVTEADVAAIGEKLKGITETILNELDSDRNTALATLNPLKAVMSEDRFAEVTQKVEDSYKTQAEKVELWEKSINAIVSTAQEERRGLTEAEAAAIENIQEKMKETGIKYLSESETESNLILQRLKDNAAQLSAEQASEMIKNAIVARDETIAAAHEQYDGICMEAQRMLDTGTISKDEYDDIIAAAEKQEMIRLLPLKTSTLIFSLPLRVKWASMPSTSTTRPARSSLIGECCVIRYRPSGAKCGITSGSGGRKKRFHFSVKWLPNVSNSRQKRKNSSKT